MKFGKYFNLVGKYFNLVILLFCVVGFIVELLYPSISDAPVFVLGYLGIFYCLYYIVIFFCPITRDWILVKGAFLIKVVNFVLLIPFVITFIFHCISKYESKNFSPKNLVFDEKLYVIHDNSIDTLVVINNGALKSALYVKAQDLETIYDTILVRKNNISDCEIEKQEDPSLFWTIYYHYIDPGNQHMTTSEVGRKRAALIAILGFLLLNGLLVTTLISWFDRRRDQWIKGEIPYEYFQRWWRRRQHYIVIGGSDVVVGIVKQLLEKKSFLHPYPYVVIQTSSDVDTLRRKLFSTITTERQQKHIIIYYGSTTSEEDLRRLGLNNVKEVYIIGEDTRPDDVDSYHDTLNMECLKLLQKLYMQTAKGKNVTKMIDRVIEYKIELREQKSNEAALRSDVNNQKLEERWKNRQRLNCRVMFEYQTTFSVFQFFDIDEQMNAYINFRPFNYYEMWAQKVFINREVQQDVIEKNFNGMKGYLPLEGSMGIRKDSDNYVHLFVVGMSRMGVAMGIEAAHLAHYPNYTEENKIRTKITFIDTNAAKEKEFFIGRFKDLFNLSHWRYGDIDNNGKLQWKSQDTHIPMGYEHLGGDFLDIEWEFIKGGIEQNAIQNYILSSTDSRALVTIAICLPESNKAHASALYIDKKIYESERLLQVLVYNRNGNAIIDSISKNNMRYPYHGKLRSFGCAADCMAINHVEISEYIGNQIDKAYNGGKDGDSIQQEKYEGKSKEAMMWSSIYNGNTMWTKLRSIGFNPDKPNISEDLIQILADVEHNRWNIEELMMNFRPLTPSEQDDVIAQRVTKNEKKSQMAHLNLCSNKRLLEIDNMAQQYDKNITIVLGEIYQKVKERTYKS